jgi:hypothetical protein
MEEKCKNTVWSFDGMTATGRLKYSEKDLAQFHFIHHKSHMDGPGIDVGPPRLEAGD